MASSNTTVQQKKNSGKFLRETKAEIKKIVWPGKKELINSTIVVFITVLIVSVVIGIVDGIFSRLFQFLMHLVG